MNVVAESEAVQLSTLERIIEKGLSSFYEVGNALMTIRDARLYRDSHPTFEVYCKERWRMTKVHAYRLIHSAEASGAITESNPRVTPSSERQLRPLAALPKEQQATAWKEAVETAPEGKVTAKHVQEVVEKIEERKAKKRLPKYKEPKNGWLLGSQAMNHAGSAILQLERIGKDDPMRRKAFKRVTDWIENQLTEGGGSRG